MKREEIRQKSMQSRKAKALCLLLALCITATCVGLGGISAAAENDYGLTFESIGEGKCSVSGDSSLTKGDVVIPEKSPSGETVTEIRYEAFENCTGMTSVQIPESVTKIGQGAFEDCTGLTSIEIPASVTDIGLSSFAYCTGLERITVDEGNPKYYSKENCLIDKYHQRWDGDDVVEVVIAGCKTSVIPSGVARIGSRAFTGCSGLTSIEVPLGVISIEDIAFAECTGLKNLKISASVTEIGEYSFSHCTGLESITVDEGNPEYYSEGNCLLTSSRDLLLCGKNSVIPSNIKYIDHAFQGCTWLTSILIPETVENITETAFQDCTGLRTAVVDSSFAGVLEILSYAPNLVSIYIRADLDIAVPAWFTECFPSKREVTLDGKAYLLYGTQSLNSSDEKTGVQISAEEGVLPQETVLTVKPSDYTLENAEKYTAFDISLEKDDVKVQPNGKVTVTLPIPAGFDKSKLTVYRVEADGSKTELPCTVAGETVTFETDHFSVYVLAEKEDDPSAGGSASSAAGGSDSSSSPSSAGGSGEQIPSPQTGDSGSRLPWLLLMGGSALALFGLAICRRRRDISGQ